MSDGDRGQLTATLGAVLAVTVLVLFSWAVWDIAALTTREALRAENNSRQHASRAEQDIQSTCIRLDPASQAECIRKVIEASQEAQNTEYDLAAQKQMARWAGWLLAVSAITLLVTAIGVYFVRRTLAEAGRTTQAAVDTLAVTRDIGQRQLRAYMFAETAQLYNFETEDEPRIGVKIRNFGQTPAYKVDMWVADSMDYLPMNKRLPDYPDRAKHTIMPPGAFSGMFIRIGPLSPYHKQRLRNGTAMITVYGRIKYEDAFGKRRTTKFRFEFGGEAEIRPDGGMVAAHEGNEAT